MSKLIKEIKKIGEQAAQVLGLGMRLGVEAGLDGVDDGLLQVHAELRQLVVPCAAGRGSSASGPVPPGRVASPPSGQGERAGRPARHASRTSPGWG